MTESIDKLARLARGQLTEASNAKLSKRVRRIHAKQLARVEFVQDAEQRSALAIWKRRDRPYRDLWTADAFAKMVSQLGWKDEREAFWEDVHHYVQEEAKKSAAQQLLNETAALKGGFDALLEYFQPLRDESGDVQRHASTCPSPGGEGEIDNPYAGLPVFPLELRSFDQTAPAMLKIYDRLIANRAIIDGSNQPRGVGGRVDEDGTPIDSGGGPAPTPDVIAEIARQLVTHGQATMDDFDSTALPGAEEHGEYDDIDDGFGEAPEGEDAL